MKTVLLLVMVCWCTGCWAEPIPKERAVLAIIGEAENQGLVGMTYIGCAIRNRGTLKGVYGERAPRVVNHLYTAKIKAQAELAWANSGDSSMCSDLKGAKHWENTDAFGLPYWARDMRVVFVYKDHKFFK